MPAQMPMPFSRSTAETMLPLTPWSFSNDSSAGLLPSPQSQIEFAGSFPSAILLRLTG